MLIKRFAAYLVKLRVPRESCCVLFSLFVCLFFSQIVLTIKTAVKRPSFKEKKKKKKKHLKRVNQIEEINGLGSTYVRRRTFLVSVCAMVVLL